jgi:multidrug resistance efflux pump
MSRSRILVALVLVLAVAGGIWFVAGRAGSGGPTGAEPSPTLPPVEASNTVTSDARAVPIHHVELSAPGAGGVVAEVLVAEGDAVTVGQPLLRLDDARAQAALDEAKAAADAAPLAVRNAQAAAAQASAQVDAARAAVDEADAAVRAADATRDGTPSGDAKRAANAQVDGARAGVRAARAQLDSARAAARQAQVAVDQATADVARTAATLAGAQAAVDELTLTAPMAGTVASLDAEVGQTVTAAAPVVRIADPSGWRFETIDLDEASIGRLAVGAKATVNVDAFEDVDIPATVESISAFGETSAGDIVYTVTLEPTGTVPEGLRWNMTASAQIEATP